MMTLSSASMVLVLPVPGGPCTAIAQMAKTYYQHAPLSLCTYTHGICPEQAAHAQCIVVCVDVSTCTAVSMAVKKTRIHTSIAVAELVTGKLLTGLCIS